MSVGHAPLTVCSRRDEIYWSTGDGRLNAKDDSASGATRTPGRGLGIVVGDFDDSLGIEALIANDMFRTISMILESVQSSQSKKSALCEAWPLMARETYKDRWALRGRGS